MISILISTITNDYQALNSVIDSILRPECPYKCEVVLVTPKNAKDFRRENVIHVKESISTGSCQAYNTGLMYASGDYIGTTTDDMTFIENWWAFVPIVQQAGFVSFKTGFLNVPVPHIFGVNRAFLEGPMKGILFNPALTHMYLDNDLGFRLDKIGFAMPTLWIFDKAINNNDKNKSDSKLKSYRLDGMIFNHIWKNRWPNLPSLATLYPESAYTNKELHEKMCKLLLNDISGECYDAPQFEERIKRSVKITSGTTCSMGHYYSFNGAFW